MFKYVHYVVGGLVVLPFALAIGIVIGVKWHKDTIESRVKDDKIVILKEGRRIDEQVFNADDAALCDLIGGC